MAFSGICSGACSPVTEPVQFAWKCNAWKRRNVVGKHGPAVVRQKIDADRRAEACWRSDRLNRNYGIMQITMRSPGMNWFNVSLLFISANTCCSFLLFSLLPTFFLLSLPSIARARCNVVLRITARPYKYVHSDNNPTLGPSTVSFQPITRKNRSRFRPRYDDPLATDTCLTEFILHGEILTGNVHRLRYFAKTWQGIFPTRWIFVLNSQD